MKRILLFMVGSMLLIGCSSSPYEKGGKIAEKYNACMADYDKALEKVGEEFSGNIVGNYNSRSEAITDYLQMLLKCHQEYFEKWTEIESEEQQVRRKMRSASDMSEFEAGLKTDREYYVFASEPNRETLTVPPVVLQAIRKINPPKPDEAQIALDLVGHTLAEGKENGYYPKSWTWKIAEGSVSDLQIVSTQENSATRYEIIVSMRLSSETRAYDAKVSISYILDDISDWKIEFVRSLGLDIVKTHKYDDCVKCYFTDGIAGGLTAENNCDIALEVAGKELNYSGEWETFSRVVPPHEQVHISWTRLDFKVDYVERP